MKTCYVSPQRAIASAQARTLVSRASVPPPEELQGRRFPARVGGEEQLVVSVCTPKEDSTKLLSYFLYRVRDNGAKCFKNPISTSFYGINDKFIIPCSFM